MPLQPAAVTVDWAREERKWIEFIEEHVRLEEGKAYVTRAAFDKLDDYSCTVPSGQVPNKVWKRGDPYRGPRTWWLGQYMSCDDPEYINIVWRELYIVDTGFEAGPQRATDDLIAALKAASTMEAR